MRRRRPEYVGSGEVEGTDPDAHARFVLQARNGEIWAAATLEDRRAAARWPWIAGALWPDMPELWPGQAERHATIRLDLDATGYLYAFRAEDRRRSLEALGLADEPGAALGDE